MKVKWAGVLCALLWLMVPGTAFAQQNGTVAPPEQTPQPPCEGAECNDTAEPSAAPLGIADALAVDELASSWEKHIDILLESYGLSASLFGKLIATLIVLLAVLMLSYLLRLLITRLFQRIPTHTAHLHLNANRLHLYQRILIIFVRLVVLCLGALSLIVVWGGSANALALGEHVSGLFSTIANIALLFVLAVVVFELVSAAMEHYFTKLARGGSTRLNTLLPIVRNVAYGALLVIFGITFLSELGIDVVPLLAGAGVVGIAIGFGAQALVKDVITGFIIILEDLIQVGDVATLGGKGGIIERITIRKVQLRDLSGTVYTVPFSEISIVENLTKGFSYYLMDVGIAYRESPDEVIALLREIVEEMRQDDTYADNILEALDVLGVDQFADSAIIIKARIKTRPIKQWEVGREFNRRMKYRFDEAGIEIPFPHQTIYFGEDKQGGAPPARLEVLRQPVERQQRSPHGEQAS